MIKLFMQLLVGDLFRFRDRPDRILVKSDRTHYVGPEGRRSIDPTAEVMVDQKPAQPRTSIFELLIGVIYNGRRRNGPEENNSTDVKNNET